MSSLTPPEKIHYGKKNPQIIKYDGEWHLIANQLQAGLIKEVRSGAKPVCIQEVAGGGHKIRPYRYNIFVSEHQDFETSEWTFSHHRIDMQGVLAATHVKCPRLLFRVFSDQSMGVNTRECFRSEAFKQNKEFTPMKNVPETELSENLRGHINGRKKNFVSHWISFTMSPLFAFWLALDMKRRKDTSICIAIINTLELPCPLQIFAAEPLMRALGVGEMKMKNLAATEFVAWDKVDTPGTVISLEKFLKVYDIKRGYVKQAYQGLNPSVFKPLHQKSIEKIREDLGKTPMTELRPPSQLRRSNYPKTEMQVYEIRRTFAGKQVNDKLSFDKRVPIDPHTLHNVYESVEETFPNNLRFDMLIELLSFRLYHFDSESIVERLREMLDVNHPMLNENGKRYQGYVRDVPTPTLPEIDAYEHLLEEVCKVQGIKVHRLSSLEQPRNFKTLEIPYTTLPIFDDTSEARAKDCLEKAKQAFMRRKAKEKIEEEAHQKKLRYEENRKRARERKALMGSRLFQISPEEQQEDGFRVPPPIKNLISTATETQAEVDDAEVAGAEYEGLSNEEEDGEDEEEEECEGMEDQESREKAILECESGLTGPACAEWSDTDFRSPNLSRLENPEAKLPVACERKKATIFQEADLKSERASMRDLQVENHGIVGRTNGPRNQATLNQTELVKLNLESGKKRSADITGPTAMKKRKIEDNVRYSREDEANEMLSTAPSLDRGNFGATPSARKATAGTPNKPQSSGMSQGNPAYQAFQETAFFKPGGDPNFDYGLSTGKRRTPTDVEKAGERLDLESDGARAVLSQAYHENPYFK